MFKCSAPRMKEFAETDIWQDMLQEMEGWKQKILEELSRPTFNHETGKMDFSRPERELYDEMLRGSLLAIGRVERLPLMIAEIIEQDMEEKPGEKQDAEE